MNIQSLLLIMNLFIVDFPLLLDFLTICDKKEKYEKPSLSVLSVQFNSVKYTEKAIQQTSRVFQSNLTELCSH